MAKNFEMSGKGTAVIVGVICLIAPWFSEISFWSKLIISLVGIVLIVLGTRD